MRSVVSSLLCLASFASIHAQAEEPTAAIGKQLAAESGIQWDAREVDHPLLGPIRFAMRKNEVATAVRNEKILSNVYVSCERKSATVAIELTNARATDLAGGLGPADLPRLVCNSPGPQGGMIKSEVAASWEIGTLGDALARGLAPAALRQCASIDVLQNLALPSGWPLPTQRVVMQITPYARELDSVFARCGEASAFSGDDARPAVAAARRAAPAPAPATTPAPRGNQAAQEKELPWKAARAIAKGRTNVRAAPSIDAPVVIRLDPGTPILVQPTAAPWWRVKSPSGAGFSGFVRQDRLEPDRPSPAPAARQR